jgi:hypothetical protein
MAQLFSKVEAIPHLRDRFYISDQHKAQYGDKRGPDTVNS